MPFFRSRRYGVAVMASALLFFAALIAGDHQSASVSNAFSSSNDSNNATATNNQTQNNATNGAQPMACTRDAFPCPDGHLVYRDPFNNCSFTKCEDSEHNITSELGSWDGSGSGSQGESQDEDEDASQSGSQDYEEELDDLIIWAAIANTSSENVQNATIYALQHWSSKCNASFDFNVTGSNNLTADLAKYDLEVNVSCLPYGDVSLHVMVDVNQTSGGWWIQQCYYGSINILEVVNETSIVCGDPFLYNENEDEKDDEKDDQDDEDGDSVNVASASSESHSALFSGMGGTVLIIVSVVGMFAVIVAGFVFAKSIRRSRTNREDTSVLSDDVEAAVHQENAASEETAATSETETAEIDAAVLAKATKSTRGEEGAFMNTPKV